MAIPTYTFYKRSGEQVTESRVMAAKANYAHAKRSGDLGNGLRCRINTKVADRVEAMELIEFCNWSGQFTYRVSR